MNLALQLVLAIGCMSLVMTSLWFLQRRTGDAGIVDVAWGLGVGCLAIFFCVVNAGLPARRVVIACLAMAWAVRLSAHVLRRVLQLPEDGRYQKLKSEWGASASAKMFRFYQFQALASVLFALPMLIAARNPSAWGFFDLLGVVIWTIAIGGESLADYQLDQFRDNPENKGQVCQQGLWRYSRHPNYFFEWLHWWTYVCFAVGAAWGWLTIAFPLAMLYFITRVTGIPPTEAQAVRSRGDAYREYQRTTSAFFPWPPHKPKAVG
ncbi:MAG: DUF1295 domain-containing protein [Planctomycetota bacterium]